MQVAYANYARFCKFCSITHYTGSVLLSFVTVPDEFAFCSTSPELDKLSILVLNYVLPHSLTNQFGCVEATLSGEALHLYEVRFVYAKRHALGIGAYFVRHGVPFDLFCSAVWCVTRMLVFGHLHTVYAASSWSLSLSPFGLILKYLDASLGRASV